MFGVFVLGAHSVSAAIAFDALSKSTGVGVSSVTLAHTISGSNRMLFVSFMTNNTLDLVTSVTYNGTAMTKLKQQATASAGLLSYVYGLAAPDTGSNNIVISVSAPSLIYTTNASYTGVDQTLPTGTAIDANNTTGTTWSEDVVTTADNSWIFMHGRNPPTQTVTSGNVRATNDPDDGMCGDVIAATAGTNSIAGTNGGPPANQTTIAVGFAPATGGGGAAQSGQQLEE